MLSLAWHLFICLRSIGSKCTFGVICSPMASNFKLNRHLSRIIVARSRVQLHSMLLAFAQSIWWPYQWARWVYNPPRSCSSFRLVHISTDAIWHPWAALTNQISPGNSQLEVRAENQNRLEATLEWARSRASCVWSLPSAAHNPALRAAIEWRTWKAAHATVVIGSTRRWIWWHW